jgi:GH25 family lysozyme M1 (1,4-beta-N-acetylmuramidase)
MKTIRNQVVVGSLCFFIGASVGLLGENPRDRIFDGTACSDAVINMSHHDWEATVGRTKVGEPEVKDGIFLVLHKITDGLPTPGESIDKHYIDIQKDSQRAGLQWGAYHFSRFEGLEQPGKPFKRDPIEQARYFVARVYQNRPVGAHSVLLAWDFEVDKGEMMSIPAMAVAVEEVQRLTGKYPGIYVNAGFTKHQLTNDALKDALARIKNPQMQSRAKKILHECWLWVARYDHFPPEDFAKDTPWDFWTMWQYTTNLHELETNTDGKGNPQPITPHRELRHDVGGKSGEFNYIAKPRNELNQWYTEHAWNYDLRDKTIVAKYP